MKKETRIPIWPLSIRLFHWTLVLFIVVLYATGWGDENLLQYHIHIGYLCLGIVCWRIFYGFHGPFYLRFKNFVVSPKEQWGYFLQAIRFKPPAYVGHPPPSGWMIVIFMVGIVAICISGVFVFAGEERHHFFAEILSNEMGELFRIFHKWSSYFLLLMIFIHVSGVLLDSFLHQVNLVKAMFNGKKEVSPNLAQEFQDKYQEGSWSWKSVVPLLMLLVTLGFAAVQQSELLSPDPPKPLVLGEKGTLWKEECSACHQPFHPSLLPARSWTKLVAGLEDHFGEDAFLEEEDAQAVLAFLHQNSAETSSLEAAYKISRSIPKNEVPIAMTETPYWKEKHDEVSPETFQHPKILSKANCLACHQDAETGSFEDHLVAIPDEAK